jgi:group I intron endonuclease
MNSFVDMCEYKVYGFYVYGLFHPLTGELRYVGQTNNLKRRFKEHIGDRNEGRWINNWINKLYKQKLRPKMFLFVEFGIDNLDDLLSAERFWIALCRFGGARLINLTEGGEGTLGYKHTPEECKKISDRLRGVKKPPFTAEHKAKIAISSKGNKAQNTSPESLAKFKAKQDGHPVSDETRKKIGAANKGRLVGIPRPKWIIEKAHEALKAMGPQLREKAFRWRKDISTEDIIKMIKDGMSIKDVAINLETGMTTVKRRIHFYLDSLPEIERNYLILYFKQIRVIRGPRKLRAS